MDDGEMAGCRDERSGEAKGVPALICKAATLNA